MFSFPDVLYTSDTRMVIVFLEIIIYTPQNQMSNTLRVLEVDFVSMPWIALWNIHWISEYGTVEG